LRGKVAKISLLKRSGVEGISEKKLGFEGSERENNR
jgi:hypothetical protein